MDFKPWCSDRIQPSFKNQSAYIFKTGSDQNPRIRIRNPDLDLEMIINNIWQKKNKKNEGEDWVTNP